MILVISWQENRFWMNHLYYCIINVQANSSDGAKSLGSNILVCKPIELLCASSSAYLASCHTMTWNYAVLECLQNFYYSFAQTIATAGTLFCSKGEKMMHFDMLCLMVTVVKFNFWPFWQQWQVKLNFCLTEMLLLWQKQHEITLLPWMKINHE